MGAGPRRIFATSRTGWPAAVPRATGFLAAEDAVGAPKREGARRPDVLVGCEVDAVGLTGTLAAAAVVGAR